MEWRGLDMKLIIAGSRDFDDYDELVDAISKLPFKSEITEVVSGKASGVDRLGERWAKENDIPVKSFPAKWNDIKDKPEHEIKDKQGRKYWVVAGHARNKEMAEYGDVLLAIWKNRSSGTRNMIENMNLVGKPVYTRLKGE